jgi:hypothetical protein
MSEFDNLKNEAEQAAQQHPEQVKEGEQFAEKEGKDLAGKEFGGQGDQGGQDSGQGGQDSGQNQ